MGGRIHTLRDARFPLPVELGAEFIHSREGEIWDLLAAAGGSAYFADGDHWHLRNNRLRNDNAFWDNVGKVLSHLDAVKSRDMSFNDFLRSRLRGNMPAAAKQMARDFVEGFHAAPADRISALSIKAAEGGDDDPSGASDSFRILGGYDAVIRALTARFAPHDHAILLSTIVKTIRWRRGQVQLEVQSPCGEPLEPIRARRAIVTLPIGVLRSETVTFDPDVPDKRDAWRQIEMGPVVKVFARFREPFWETRQLPRAPANTPLKEMSFMHARQAAFPTWWSYWPVRGDVLTAWAGGPAAARLALRPQRQILDAALTSLTQITGYTRARLQKLLLRAHLADWQADPFARGAYSFIPVDGIKAPTTLAKPVDQTLFFAGEATASEGLGGTVDAALTTGRRAADEVLSTR